MWRHDCSREWPVDCGHESLCSGSHVERTEEQGHSDGHLLAWQPRIVLTSVSGLDSFCGLVKEAPPVWRVYWAADTGPKHWHHPVFPLCSEISSRQPQGLIFQMLSVAAKTVTRLDASGFCACSSSVMNRVTFAIPPSTATHCSIRSAPCPGDSAPCPGDRAAEGRILGFPHFPLVPTFQDFYTIYKVTFWLVSTVVFSTQMKT